MPFILETPEDQSDYEYSVTLGGLEYIIRITWNEVFNSWFMSIRNYAGDPVVLGVRIVSFQPLVNIYKSSNVPDGRIICVQNYEGSWETPSRDSFTDGTHSLIYITEAELDETFT